MRKKGQKGERQERSEENTHLPEESTHLKEEQNGKARTMELGVELTECVQVFRQWLHANLNSALPICSFPSLPSFLSFPADSVLPCEPGPPLRSDST